MSISLLILGTILPVYGHQDGCHRWHSCPSDSGSYTCGDKGYCSECPNNNFCYNGQPKSSSSSSSSSSGYSSSSSGQQYTQESISKYTTKIDQLTKENSKLKQENFDLKSQIKQLNKKIDSLNSIIREQLNVILQWIQSK
ncbi:MAG: hypothetical protein DWQ19_04905 [Crenarchaeota archaeon]|nr:MAG: hypothetical protein DWQ13_05930 [Thermoproteota archaeon]RDJ37777.1 MAG: hypothetical protein DWQ19_04905 [Thermoproteota archaeon]